MMNFRVIKDAILETLCINQGSDFRVVGHQKQTKSAKEVTNDNKLVQVLYREGELPARGSSNISGAKHNLIFNIEFTVSAAAKGDIATATDSTATALERAAAISAIKEAVEMVDCQLDEFIDRVYQILMDASNRDFGLAKGIVSGRRIERIRKDDTIEDGSLVLKTGMFDLVCSTFEAVQGLIDPNAGEEKTIDTVIENVGDDVGQLGVEITTPSA